MTPDFPAATHPGSSMAETGFARQGDAMQMLRDVTLFPTRPAQAITPRGPTLPAPPFPHTVRLAMPR